MSSSSAFGDPQAPARWTQNACPHWCVMQHEVHLGEEDWIHTSAPVPVADGLAARLCMSVDPGTGVKDGPYVLIGTSEYTLTEARILGDSLIRLASADESYQ
jgi:hypothetical protein